MAALLYDGSLKAGKSNKVMIFLHEMGIAATSQSHEMSLDLFKNETKERSETEITKLKQAIKKLEAEKEAGLAQFYKLLKKASDLESRVISAEEESRVLKHQVSKHEKISCLEKKLLEEGFSLEVEKGVMVDFIEGIAFDTDQVLQENVVLENEKDSLMSQVEDLRAMIDGLELEFGKRECENEALLLEKLVLVWFLAELKIEAEGVEEVRKTVLDAENLNNELSILQKSYRNLQTQMAKVVQENRVLKNLLELRQQNQALSEDLIHEDEQSIVATRTRENSIEVLNYCEEFITEDERKYPEAMEIQLMKETKLDRIITVEKAVKTLAEEMRFHYTVDDHRRVCKIKHSNTLKSHSNTKYDGDRKGELCVMEHGRERKHKSLISEFGKKLFQINYMAKSRSAMRQGEQVGKKKWFLCTHSVTGEDRSTM